VRNLRYQNLLVVVPPGQEKKAEFRAMCGEMFRIDAEAKQLLQQAEQNVAVAQQALRAFGATHGPPPPPNAAPPRAPGARERWTGPQRGRLVYNGYDHLVQKPAANLLTETVGELIARGDPLVEHKASGTAAYRTFRSILRGEPGFSVPKSVLPRLKLLRLAMDIQNTAMDEPGMFADAPDVEDEGDEDD
jgi:hypothetical protein